MKRNSHFPMAQRLDFWREATGREMGESKNCNLRCNCNREIRRIRQVFRPFVVIMEVV